MPPGVPRVRTSLARQEVSKGSCASPSAWSERLFTDDAGVGSYQLAGAENYQDGVGLPLLPLTG
jgi:hypothetical protein